MWSKAQKTQQSNVLGSNRTIVLAFVNELVLGEGRVVGDLDLKADLVVKSEIASVYREKKIGGNLAQVGLDFEELVHANSIRNVSLISRKLERKLIATYHHQSTSQLLCLRDRLRQECPL